MNKKLYRSRREKMLGGVCGGLADYFDIDPTLVRIIFVVTLFMGGSGVVAYILLLIVVPEEPLNFQTSWEPKPASPDEESGGDEKAEDKKAEFTQTPHYSYYKFEEEKKTKRMTFIGAFLILLGLFFLADNFIPRFNFHDFFPLIIVAIGIGLILNSKRPKDQRGI